ncbi:cytochrome o ubiquinol oxidase subunit IV [uncultured Pseudosulfitobacter sp.]|jgi:cytochrome o ubiquinol oxidase operon protein cyoD|uniref:cytochrome o ubiquinol oxidase subunit IV n=1 Tax=uncultured Pseudosulfitobacter sp. TaxID=2854214 RepID=UPI0030DB929B|tara:strand:+ start:28155 stop:28520 length:366 start_codon:yes stop_codon:yes gene_type:complete
MSAEQHDTHDAHGSYRSYLIGFGLSVVLTAIPFWIVLGEVDIHLWLALTIIFGLGAVQIIVHVVYFLHVTVKAEEGWKVMSLVFTGILLLIVLVGSIWVMTHLNNNMMPAHDQIERVRALE